MGGLSAIRRSGGFRGKGTFSEGLALWLPSLSDPTSVASAAPIVHRTARSRSTSTRRSSFPVGDFGSWSISSIAARRLYGATRSAT